MKSSEFRYYAELNEFLAPDARRKRISHSFLGKPSIKDVIESMGVPHTEVDLILVNGRSVGFSYALKDGDKVSVYPVFESMDIAGLVRLRKKPLRNPTFLTDVHLGKLAKYLRMAGFDTLYENHWSDSELVRMALRDRRILLTRDRGLLKNKLVTHGYWVRSDDPGKQISEILERFDLFSRMKPFTICLECNGKIRRVSKDRIQDRLPPKTKKYYKRFYVCLSCERVYWQGSHYERMNTLLSKLKEKGTRQRLGRTS